MDYAELARQQNKAATSILESSLDDPDCLQSLTKSYRYVTDISSCTSKIQTRRENKLFCHSVKEFQFGLFALNQGFYRHAFSSLRLSLELALSAVEFSTKEMSLRQWEIGAYDINWGRIINSETGVFSTNFLRIFCSGIEERGAHYRTLSEKLYRECSEYVHGNASTHTELPTEIKFSKELVLAWCDKAASVHMIVLFSFFTRYLSDMNEPERKDIEYPFLETLGHIKEVRTTFGAPV